MTLARAGKNEYHHASAKPVGAPHQLSTCSGRGRSWPERPQPLGTLALGRLIPGAGMPYVWVPGCFAPLPSCLPTPPLPAFATYWPSCSHLYCPSMLETGKWSELNCSSPLVGSVGTSKPPRGWSYAAPCTTCVLPSLMQITHCFSFLNTTRAITIINKNKNHSNQHKHIPAIHLINFC